MPSSIKLITNLYDYNDSYPNKINLFNQQVKDELRSNVALLNMGMKKNDSGSDS